MRRSSPSNRWILSTNTDMIFVPHGATSLSEIARGLAPGFYHAPRMEIPEVLWESLNRYDAANIIETIRDWGKSLHLNEIVLGSSSYVMTGRATSNYSCVPIYSTTMASTKRCCSAGMLIQTLQHECC